MATKKTKATKEQVGKVLEEVAVKYSKQQLLQSEKYRYRRDAIEALLKDDEKYTRAQVDNLLDQFYKGGNK